MTIDIPSGVAIYELTWDPQGKEVLEPLDVARVPQDQEGDVMNEINFVSKNLDKPDPYASSSFNVSKDNFPEYVHFVVKRAE